MYTEYLYETPTLDSRYEYETNLQTHSGTREPWILKYLDGENAVDESGHESGYLPFHTAASSIDIFTL